MGGCAFATLRRGFCSKPTVGNIRIQLETWKEAEADVDLKIQTSHISYVTRQWSAAEGQKSGEKHLLDW